MSPRLLLAALLLLALTAGCGGGASTTPEPTPRGTISPSAGLNPAELLLVDRLPAWVDRGGCKGGARANASTLTASIVCGGTAAGFQFSPAFVVAITQQRVVLTADAYLDRLWETWRFNTPEMTPAPGCVEGPWIGRWDVNGEIVGALACRGTPGAIEYVWLDERTGLQGLATFGVRSWADAYRSWLQDGLADMTSPRR